MNEYQKYQLQWMIEHGYSIYDLILELTDFQFEDPEDSDRISTPISELFDEWVSDRGFDSEIWACESEWFNFEGCTSDDENVIDAEFTSVWDGGIAITTPCKVNLATKEIFDINISIDNADAIDELNEEYVTIDDTKYPAIEYDYYDNDYKKDGYYWYR